MNINILKLNYLSIKMYSYIYKIKKKILIIKILIIYNNKY